MKKTRFLVIGCMILSVFVLLAVAAENVEEKQTNEEENVTNSEMVDKAEVEVADPNSADEKLKKAWADAERANNSEAKRWMELEMSKRVELARAAQRTTEAQLALLKTIAESEGATQTVAAIDKIIETRAAKVDEVLDEAREARRQERMKELEERRKAREEMRKSRREQMNQQ